MNRTLSTLPERALKLAGRLGDGIRDAVPDKAAGWVGTGAALGALKTGSRVATRFVRRNPAIAIAAAGAGLLLYAARRQALKAPAGAIEGSSRRVEARRVEVAARRPRNAGAGKPAASRGTARKRATRRTSTD